MKYNLKLLFSPTRWFCYLLFVAMIPIFMYAPTYYDFTNISSLYIPFVGVALFTNLLIIDKNNNFAETMYVSNQKPFKIFLQRYCIISVFLLIIILLGNGIFRFFQIIHNNFAWEPISLMEYVMITCGSSLLLGTLSMSIANVLNNPYAGYGMALLYWLYWNINLKKQSLFNPFPFIASPTFYEKFLVEEYLLVIGLLVFNGLLARKSLFERFVFLENIRNLTRLKRGLRVKKIV